MTAQRRFVGEQYGRLTIEQIISGCAEHRMRLRVRCRCGVSHMIFASNWGRRTRSCGCLQAEVKRKINFKHGMGNTPEYHAWKSLVARCCVKKNPSYPNYGGRGICVYAPWRRNFLAFYRDLGPRPSSQHTIDRIDNDGHYTPHNCRWVEWREQYRNQRRTHKITYRGETLCLRDWADRLGMCEKTLGYRVQHWSLERAFTKEVQHHDH